MKHVVLSARQRAELRDYIVRHSAPVAEDGCWLWLRSFGSHDYGATRIPGARSMSTAPKASFLAFNGPLPRGKVPRHTCDHKWCTNPEHLVAGTHLQNMRDKHRTHNAAWRTPHRAPLVVADVLEIRALSAVGHSSRWIAPKFNLTKTAVVDIVNRRAWSHV